MKNTRHTVPLALASQTGIFLFGNLFTLVAGFPFQIYLANKLGAENLGVFTLFDAAMQTLSGLLSFGIGFTTVRFIPQYLEKREFTEIRALVSYGLKILAISGTAGYLLVIAASGLLADWWLFLRDYRQYVEIAALLIPINLFSFFCTQSLRGFQDILYIVVGTSFVQLIVKIIASVIFFQSGYILSGYLWAVIISSIVSTCWMGFGLYRNIRNLKEHQAAKPLTDQRRSWYEYARIMYSNTLLGIISAPLDKFLLGYFGGMKMVGILSVIKSLHQLPAYFLQMFLAVLAPMFSAAHARNDRDGRQSLYHLSTDWLMRLSLPLLLFLLIFTGPMLELFGTEFSGSGTLALRILLLGQFVNLLTGPAGNILNMSGEERALFRLNIVQTLGMSALFVILVPVWGLTGAALALSTGTIFLNFFGVRLLKTSLSVSWWDVRYRKWFIPAIACSALGVLMSFLLPTGKIGLIFELGLIYILFHALYLFKGMNADDGMVWNSIRSKLFPVDQR